MTILQVITCSNLGGAQSVVACLSNALCREHKVIVVAGEGDGKLWNMLDERVVREPCMCLRRALSPLNDVKACFSLRALCGKYKPDVIHLHSSKAGMLGRVALPKSKIVYTVHGFDSIRVAYRKLLPIEKLMQRRCQYIVGVSKYDEKHLYEEGITHHVRMVYNGIPQSDNGAVCSVDWQSISDGYEKTVLCIARLSPQKNVSLFLQIAALLPQYAFVWIGNQQPVTEPHGKNVYFLGNIQEAGVCCKMADMFVLPSNYEGLPMVLIEAMRAGLPVVASNVGGVSEIVRNGENGFALENKAEVFADKIKYILEREDIYKAFAEKSARIFSTEQTAEQMVDGYKKLYDRIINK